MRCCPVERPHSGRTSDDVEANRISKEDQQYTKEAWRKSIVYENLTQQRAREVGVGLSNFESTTNGAFRVDDSTTEGAEIVDGSATDGVPSVDPIYSEKPNPLAS